MTGQIGHKPFIVFIKNHLTFEMTKLFIENLVLRRQFKKEWYLIFITDIILPKQYKSETDFKKKTSALADFFSVSPNSPKPTTPFPTSPILSKPYTFSLNIIKLNCKYNLFLQYYLRYLSCLHEHYLDSHWAFFCKYIHIFLFTSSKLNTDLSLNTKKYILLLKWQS